MNFNDRCNVAAETVPALVFLHVATQTIYYRGNVNIQGDYGLNGWQVKNLQHVLDDCKPELACAIHLKNSGLMAPDKKICGVKLIRAQTGVGLKDAKDAYEIADAMDMGLVVQMSGDLYNRQQRRAS